MRKQQKLELKYKIGKIHSKVKRNAFFVPEIATFLLGKYGSIYLFQIDVINSVDNIIITSLVKFGSLFILMFVFYIILKSIFKVCFNCIQHTYKHNKINK